MSFGASPLDPTQMPEGPDDRSPAMAHHATPEMADRLWARVDKGSSTECWQWIGSRDAAGYGIFFITKAGGVKKSGMAHRLAYEMVTGRMVPDDMQIDHICRNKSCVNPDHLEVVTALVNGIRANNASAVNRRKTHCKAGHEFSGVEPTPYGVKRICRTCRENRRHAA